MRTERARGIASSILRDEGSEQLIRGYGRVWRKLPKERMDHGNPGGKLEIPGVV